jgi:sorbitol-specific phosphotransferase system component IIBC
MPEPETQGNGAPSRVTLSLVYHTIDEIKELMNVQFAAVGIRLGAVEKAQRDSEVRGYDTLLRVFLVFVAVMSTLIAALVAAGVTLIVNS